MHGVENGRDCPGSVAHCRKHCVVIAARYTVMVCAAVQTMLLLPEEEAEEEDDDDAMTAPAPADGEMVTPTNWFESAEDRRRRRRDAADGAVAVSMVTAPGRMRGGPSPQVPSETSTAEWRRAVKKDDGASQRVPHKNNNNRGEPTAQ